MKNYEIESKNFYDSQLIVRFYKIYTKTKSVIINNSKNKVAYYNIFYITSGNFQVVSYGKTQLLHPGDIFIAKPFEKFELIALSEKEKSRFIGIYFLINLFDNVKSDSNFLRAFNDRNYGDPSVYKPTDFTSSSALAEVFKMYDCYILKNSSLCHYAFLTGTLITMLDFAFDEKYKKISSDNNTDYDAKIYDYIVSNFTSTLTSDMVVKKFSVSKWYLDKVTKEFYGLPFLKTVRNLRMWHARGLMKLKTFKLTDIAKLSGYNDYSSFYKCYVSCFGISPKQDMKIYYETNEFYKHKV